MSQERRQHARFVIDLAVEIRSGESVFTATTKDISAGGCCVEGAYPLKEDSQVGCELYVVVDGIEESSLPSMQLHAQVQWTADTEAEESESRYIAGLRFLDINDAQRQWLEGVIAKAEASHQ